MNTTAILQDMIKYRESEEDENDSMFFEGIHVEEILKNIVFWELNRKITVLKNGLFSVVLGPFTRLSAEFYNIKTENIISSLYFSPKYYFSIIYIRDKASNFVVSRGFYGTRIGIEFDKVLIFDGKDIATDYKKNPELLDRFSLVSGIPIDGSFTENLSIFFSENVFESTELPAPETDPEGNIYYRKIGICNDDMSIE